MEMIIVGADLPEEPQAPKSPGRPKGSTAKRMTDFEKSEFIKQSIVAIMENHFSYTEYCKWCREFHNLSNSQANEYWMKVWQLLKKKFELEKEKLILKHTKKYWDIYQRAYDSGDLTNARQALNDLTKLQGLAEPDKVHITGTSIKLNFGEPNVE